MTIPLLSSQKHDSSVDKHGAALGAARSGLYKQIKIVALAADHASVAPSVEPLSYDRSIYIFNNVYSLQV